MLGFIKYGGREPDAREAEVATEGVDDIGMGVEEEEKTVDREEEEGVGRCPFPVAAEGNMVCRSASVCPGVWRNDDPLPPIRSGWLMCPKLPSREVEFRPTGGKFIPLEPMDRPGKCVAAEACLPPTCALPWLSVLLRLVPRISNAELRSSSRSCLLRSLVWLFRELTPSPTGTVEQSWDKGNSFPMPATASPVDEV